MDLVTFTEDSLNGKAHFCAVFIRKCSESLKWFGAKKEIKLII